ncbi:hypothetical protein MLD38_038204 [Melastoma candidum]|uniref:Uncharacterized protein n=1 Tax=Melastoma candidum TaxID=119954 RepID=A0ACB9KYS8_9MYRT|nr:hypothetical protein MLD38_038204 [Melastoma candidum]
MTSSSSSMPSPRPSFEKTGVGVPQRSVLSWGEDRLLWRPSPLLSPSGSPLRGTQPSREMIVDRRQRVTLSLRRIHRRVIFSPSRLQDGSNSEKDASSQLMRLELPAEMPVYLRRLFEQMGATYIKLGVLHDVILREELGRPTDSVYDYVDPTPIASALIAQV